MKSEAPSRLQPGSEDHALLAELARRSSDAGVGTTADFADLQARDPYGADAFDTLASRFGWKHEASHWLRERVPRWTPGWLLPDDEAKWLDLFEAAFGYRMDPALMRWKYRHESLLGMGAWRGTELLASYGAMPRDVLLFGKPHRVVQIGDVMVHPRERGVLTRSGPYQLAASMYVERRAGYGRPYAFGYGFPTDKALKVAEKLGLYEQVDQMWELAWTPAPDRGLWLHRAQPLTAALRAHVDRLWKAMAAHFTGSVIGVRDWRYIEDRYLRHPLNKYVCLLVGRRLGGRPEGVVVMREHEEAGAVEVLDLVADPRHFPLLVRMARDWAARRARKRVFMWLTQSHTQLMAACAPMQAPMDLMVPAMVWQRGPTGSELRGKWWLTSGDADFR